MAIGPLPEPTPESRRVAAERFGRAQQVADSGNFDYAIQLLLTCCKIEPRNFQFRQMLRRTQKAKYHNNLRGSRLAFLTTVRTRAKLKTAKRSRDYIKVLEYGEQLLSKNPWDVSAQMDMAEAADALGLLDHAIFFLDQARQKNPRDAMLNRALARLFEKRGAFSQAIALWQLVKEVSPADVEAAHKAKDLAASETIARGGYTGSGEKATMGNGVPRPGAKTVVADGSAEHAAEPPDRMTREAAPILTRLDSNPTDAHLYLQLATVYRRGNEPDRARAALERGLGPTSNDFRLVLELTEMDLEVYRRNLAIADKKIAAAESGEDDARHTVDDLRRIRGKLVKEIAAREIEVLRTRADRFPNDPNHRLELGIRLAETDHLDEAIVELQQARKDPRYLWKAALNLGLCFKKRNNWKLAERNFEEARAQLPPSEDEGRKEVLFQLATGSAEAGELQKAIDLGHDLANLDFGYRNIGKLIDDWHQRLQDG
ncbi:MAG TPA: tetratricopeptide repeat protein [Gemmataceae bacterium]|jgi:tetratricopeptide (TPR) repeat protein|nr:tetratricopeptide repeat protein [Gemmataceae bacterium]